VTKYCGKDFLIKISDEGSPETLTTVAGMRSTSCTINGEAVDVTDKDDQPWRTTLEGCGIVSMSLSGSGHITNSTTLATLTNALTNRTNLKLNVTSGRGDKFVGEYRITSMERNGEYNGAEQYSLTFESAATITYTAPT
jgi:TP901-1 family phage major tail protein